MALAFSAIMMVGELVLPEVMRGITEAPIHHGHRVVVDAHLGRADRVENGGGDRPRRLLQLGVGRERRPRLHLHRPIRRQRRLRHDMAHQP